jgi:hypothetical protein
MCLIEHECKACPSPCPSVSGEPSLGQIRLRDIERIGLDILKHEARLSLSRKRSVIVSTDANAAEIIWS